MVLPQTLLILAKMRPIQGWLEDEEADLLIAGVSWALATVEAPHILTEVGSYCGRSTVVLASVAAALSPNARVYAIDPHQGDVGAADQKVHASPPTLERFRENIAAAGVGDRIEVITKCSFEVTWNEPIAFLLIDGLHDYMNVARDFNHFEAWVVSGGCVAFHDYSAYYPGVMAFVDELVAKGEYQTIGRAKSMILVRKKSRRFPP